VGIERRGVNFFVAEQDLDGTDIFALLEQVGGERVPERVHRDALLDVRGEAIPTARAV